MRRRGPTANLPPPGRDFRTTFVNLRPFRFFTFHRPTLREAQGVALAPDCAKLPGSPVVVWEMGTDPPFKGDLYYEHHVLTLA